MKYLKSFNEGRVNVPKASGSTTIWAGDYLHRKDVPKLKEKTKERITKAIIELQKHPEGMGVSAFAKLIVGDNFPGSKPTTTHYTPALTYLKNTGIITITPQEKRGLKTIVKLTPKGMRIKPETLVTPELIKKIEDMTAPEFYTISVGEDGYCDYTASATFKTIKEAEDFIINSIQFNIVKGTQMIGEPVGQIEEMDGRTSDTKSVEIDVLDLHSDTNKYKREKIKNKYTEDQNFMSEKS